MTLYLIHGNIYLEECGYEEHIFGAFTTLAQAEEAKLIVEKSLRDEIKNDPDIHVNDPEDIKLQILELKADELVDLFLGGYIE